MLRDQNCRTPNGFPENMKTVDVLHFCLAVGSWNSIVPGSLKASANSVFCLTRLAVCDSFSRGLGRTRKES